MPSFVKKIKNIEKINNNKSITPLQNSEIMYDKKNGNIEVLYEKKFIEDKKLNNPFIKSIKNTKFIKNKFMGIDKNNSFYKKKYEENSANYNSISDNLKDNLITTDIKITKEISKETKSLKNKILLEGIDSSDEEEEEIDL